MKSYGQFCPVVKAAELFCERWTALIVRDLALGASRFSELQRGVPLASPTILSRRLAQLEAEGVVERRRSSGAHRWTYHLTEAGRDFVPVVMALGTWGQRWGRRELAEHEVDLGLLLWAVERCARGDAFRPGAQRGRGHVSRAAGGEAALVILLNEHGRTELCLEPPGEDAVLYLEVSLRDLIRIWRGDPPLARALAEGLLDAHGTRAAVAALPGWLGVSALAEIRSRRPELPSLPAETGR